MLLNIGTVGDHGTKLELQRKFIIETTRNRHLLMNECLIVNDWEKHITEKQYKSK